ncbi:hypothetical protein [Spirillospora sp. NPDC048819]|uniref:hypothetical protein n=1 Tax=Spirillospora sp. NPDC048819 TaxID=3155268 RepID=UPI0033F76B29
MLANADNLGDTAFFVIGPIAIFFALAAWITITLMTSRKPRRPRGGNTGLPHRGPVQGGVIQGSPSQRTRRDPAPSVTHRQVVQHIEEAREREGAREREDAREREGAREREVARAAREAGEGGPRPRGLGGRRRKRGRRGKPRERGKGRLHGHQCTPPRNTGTRRPPEPAPMPRTPPGGRRPSPR